MKPVIIMMEGGLIQEILCGDDHMEIVVIDLDIEGVDEDDLELVPKGPAMNDFSGKWQGHDQAYVSVVPVTAPFEPLTEFAREKIIESRQADPITSAKAIAFDAIHALLDQPGDWSPGSDFLDAIAGIVTKIPGVKIRNPDEHEPWCIYAFNQGVREDCTCKAMPAPTCGDCDGAIDQDDSGDWVHRPPLDADDDDEHEPWPYWEDR